MESIAEIVVDPLDRGLHVAFGTVMARHRVYEGVAPIFAGGSIELGGASAQRDDQFDDMLVGDSGFVTVDLNIAPLHAGIGAVEGGELNGLLPLSPTAGSLRRSVRGRSARVAG